MERGSKVFHLIVILLGNCIYAFAVAYFILPAGLITGGTTGLAIFAHHYFGISISVFVSVFNTAMFIAGAIVLGKAFALTTLVSTFTYPLFLECMKILALRTGSLSSDPMLCTVFAGVLIGAGIALVLREGASTGGMDIQVHQVLHRPWVCDKPGYEAMRVQTDLGDGTHSGCGDSAWRFL